MKRLSIVLFISSFLLLASQNEVHAKDYLLWALGLEDTFQGSRQLRHYNFKTRERIVEARKARRQQRKEATATKRTDSAETDGGKKSHLRKKVAQMLQGEQKAEIVKVNVQDAGANAKKVDGGGKAKKRDNAHTRMNENHRERKIANHKEHLKVIAEEAEDRTIGGPGGNVIMVGHGPGIARGADRGRAAAEKEKQQVGGAAPDVEIGRAGKNTKDNAHARINKRHYLKKLIHHKENQKENAQEALDRTFGAGGGRGAGRSAARGGIPVAADKKEAGGRGRAADKPAASGRAQKTEKAAANAGGRAENHGANVHKRENERHYWKKLANHRKHQSVKAEEVLDRTFGASGGGKRLGRSPTIGRNNEGGGGMGGMKGRAAGKPPVRAEGRGKPPGRAEKKPAMTVGRAGGMGQSNAHKREKENHYLKKAANHKEHQRERAKEDASDRTFGATGGGKRAGRIPTIAREKEAGGAMGRAAVKPAGRAEKTAGRAGGRAGNHGNAHKREKQHGGPGGRRAPVEAVTLKDGGAGRRGPK